ncbi:phosphoinositide 3-kinase regulatory subunit 6 isoform X2 [Amia ocellicauda]|uniref:phosphoinositide 3-kinase regulatory subunit 6 isoform X2 n=1 Tax=Amia ocellicauda TaxID=2972642 RepID=UPI003464BBBD
MEAKVSHGVSSAVESDIYRSVQAILRELDCHHPASLYNRGMLRWTLHKKIEKNPAKIISLVKIVVKELERAERADNKLYIIPLLHTLMYAVIQSAYIPDDLFKRVYDFCKRLLTLPQPYCTVGLSYTIQIKTERMMPGVLYQRMVIAEQSLKNEQFPYQEKVLVLADPSVFSGDTGAALSQDIESASPRQSPVEYMCSVIQHTIQAALGASCDGPRLAHILQAKCQDVEQYFQEVVESVERCAEEAGPDRSQYAARLQRLYTDILRTASQDAAPPHSSPCSCLLPNPEISFLLWKEDDMLWRELAKFVRSGSSSQHLSLSQDFFEGADFSVDLGPEMTRLSIMSNDSGIERDLPVTELPPLVEEPSGGESEQEQGRLSRRNCIRMRPSVSDGMALLQDSLEEPGTSGKLQRKAGKNGMAFPRQQSLYTARIVVLGDDRVLGRLAKAFYSLRKREARRLFLTTKLNLQIYYIPVTDETQSASPVKENVSSISSKFCDLAAYLGRVDPWYESNINSLGHMIPKLVKMQSSTSKSAETDPFLVDVISYYIRMALQPVYFTIYSVKISFSSLTKETVEDVFVTQLEVDFPEFKMPTSTYKDGSVRSKKTLTEICGAVVSVSYRQASLSNRETERGVSLRTSGVLINAIPSNETEDLDCLIVTFCDSQKSKTGMEPKIRTCNIKIRTLEQKAFTVRLDKDSQRVFKDVLSIEVSPCLDPGYSVQKTRKSKFSLGDEREVGLTRYMHKGLPLPINTFAGIIQ